MALADNLKAFWKLEETSGTRNDEAGSNDLSDNNTVTGASGQIGQAAQFTNANDEFLSIADNADLSTGDIDFTIGLWAYLDNKTTIQTLLSKWETSGNQREYCIEYNLSADRFRFIISKDGTASSSVDADELGSPNTARWYFIVCWHDATGNTLNIQVDDGTPDVSSYSDGGFDSTAAFWLGRKSSSSDALDGRLDAIGFWKSVLSAAERTQLWNGGDGREHPFEISVFTGIEEVVTQSCDSDTGFNREMILPRFSSEKDDPESIARFLDEQAEIIEDKYNNQVAREVPCEICVVTGSIVLDCGKCVHFEVAADADINSISFINCVAGDELDIVFRSSKDIEITGWPSDLTCTHCGAGSSPTLLSAGQIFRRGIGFNSSGRPTAGGGIAECISACIKKTVSSGSAIGAAVDSCAESCTEGEDEAPGGGGGVPGPTETCGCTPDEGGLLTVSICTPFNCEDASPALELTVCGGTEPYTWDVVGGESPTKTDSGTSNRNTKLEPPTNTTPGESGNAYARGHGVTRHDVCPDAIFQLGAIYNCAGIQTDSCSIRTNIGSMPIKCELCWHVVTFDCCRGSTDNCGFPCVSEGGCDECEQATVDLRTQSQKDNGCKPCAAVMEGVILSVTDASGAVVSTVIET